MPIRPSPNTHNRHSFPPRSGAFGETNVSDGKEPKLADRANKLHEKIHVNEELRTKENPGTKRNEKFSIENPPAQQGALVLNSADEITDLSGNPTEDLQVQKRSSKPELARRSKTFKAENTMKRKSKQNLEMASPVPQAAAGGDKKLTKRKSRLDVTTPGDQVVGKRNSKQKANEPARNSKGNDTSKSSDNGEIANSSPAPDMTPKKRKSRSKTNLATAGETPPTKRKSRSKTNLASTGETPPIKRKSRSRSKTNIAATGETPPRKRKSKASVQAEETAQAKPKSKSVDANGGETTPLKRKSKQSDGPTGDGETTPVKRKSKASDGPRGDGESTPVKRKSKQVDAAALESGQTKRKSKPSVPGEQAKMPTRHMKSTDVGLRGTVAGERQSKTNLLPPPNRKSKSDGPSTPAKTYAGDGLPKNDSKMNGMGSEGGGAKRNSASRRRSGEKIPKRKSKEAIDQIPENAEDATGRQSKRNSTNSNPPGKSPPGLPKRKSKSSVTKVGDNSEPKRLSADKKKKSSKTNLGKRASKLSLNQKKGRDSGGPALPVTGGGKKKKGNANNELKAPSVERKVSFSKKVSVSKLPK